MKTTAASACSVFLRAVSAAKAARVHRTRLRLASLAPSTSRWVSLPLLIWLERGMSGRRRMDLDDELALRHRDDARRGLGHDRTSISFTQCGSAAGQEEAGGAEDAITLSACLF